MHGRQDLRRTSGNKRAKPSQAGKTETSVLRNGKLRYACKLVYFFLFTKFFWEEQTLIFDGTEEERLDGRLNELSRIIYISVYTDFMDFILDWRIDLF